MKQISFTTPPSPKEHAALRRFFMLSAISLFISISMSIYFYATLYMAYQKEKKSYSASAHKAVPLEEQLEKKREAKETLAALNKQLAKATRITHKPKMPTTFLQHITHLLPTESSLTALRIDNNQWHSTLEIADTNQLMLFVEQLKATPCITHLSIQSISPTQQGTIQALIEGALSYDA